MLNLLILEFAVLLFMLVWFYRCTGRTNLVGLIVAGIFICFVGCRFGYRSTIGPTRQISWLGWSRF